RLHRAQRWNQEMTLRASRVPAERDVRVAHRIANSTVPTRGRRAEERVDGFALVGGWLGV
ncbi:MAG: hypothetical protein ACRDYV_02935, partial [Acidimicrobiia bacterium]